MIQTNYELAFHLSPNLDEAGVRGIKQSTEDIIAKYKGVISYSKDPERTRLSYPVKNQSNSFFGYIQFNLSEGEGLDELNEQLRLNPDVLRYLVIKLPSDLQKRQSMLKQVKMRERLEKRAAKAKPAPPAESKELDKKLEDILENI